MHDAVVLAFPSFSERLEGRTNFLYLDINGDPTTGVGCLLKRVEDALALPWKLPDGSPASAEVVRAQYYDLKAQTRLAVLGAKYAERVTTIRLSEADIDVLMRQRLMLNEAVLSTIFANWALLPADCQIAILSMSWAMGADFWKKFPKFCAAIRAMDFASAVAECTIDGEVRNKGLVARNVANRLCLQNARAVAADIAHAGHGRGTHVLSLDRLYWPNVATSTHIDGAMS
jgi:hypothetical protein